MHSTTNDDVAAAIAAAAEREAVTSLGFLRDLIGLARQGEDAIQDSLTLIQNRSVAWKTGSAILSLRRPKAAGCMAGARRTILPVSP